MLFLYYFLQGIVNLQFAHIQNLKTKEEPDYAVKLITSYFNDVEAMLSELTDHMYLHSGIRILFFFVFLFIVIVLKH